MLVGVVQVLRPLARVEGLDPRAGELERLQRLRRAAPARRLQLRLGHAQLLGPQADPVEALGQLDECGVAAPAHLVDDVGDGPGDVGLGLAAHRQERGEARLEVALRSLQPMRHGRPPGSARSRR